MMCSHCGLDALRRVKQQWPDASPYEYADLDPDFKRFLACGSDVGACFVMVCSWGASVGAPG